MLNGQKIWLSKYSKVFFLLELMSLHLLLPTKILVQMYIILQIIINNNNRGQQIINKIIETVHSKIIIPTAIKTLLNIRIPLPSITIRKIS